MKKIALMIMMAAMLLFPIPAQALSVGVWSGAFGAFTIPTVGMQLTDSISGYLGMSRMPFESDNETYMYLVKADYNLVKLGELQTKMGAYCEMNPEYAESILGLTWGASAMVAKNVSVGFDVRLIQQYTDEGYDPKVIMLPGSSVSINLYL